MLYKNSVVALWHHLTILKNVAQRIIETKEQGNQVITVVSVMGDSTDDLLALANTITKNPPHREMDMLLATGEQVSISLLSMAIKERGYNVVSLTGAQSRYLYRYNT